MNARKVRRSKLVSTTGGNPRYLLTHIASGCAITVKRWDWVIPYTCKSWRLDPHPKGMHDFDTLAEAEEYLVGEVEGWEA